MFLGSNAFFKSLKAEYTFSPYIFFVHAPLTMPSPCSPLNAPPNSKTKSEISFDIFTIFFISFSDLRLISGLICRHPTEA